MLRQGAAKKLIVYVSEQTRWHNEPVYEAVLRFLFKQGCAGATVTKAVAGFGPKGLLQRSSLFQLREDLPMRIEMVESVEKINDVLPSIYDMVIDGLIEVQDTEIIKCYGSQIQEGG